MGRERKRGTLFSPVLVVLLIVATREGIADDGCPAEDRIDISEGIMDRSGAIRYGAGVYQPDSYNVTDGQQQQYYSCVCSRRVCIYVCCYHIDRTSCEESDLPLNRSWTPSGQRSAEVDVKGSVGYWLIYATPPAWNYTPGFALRISGYEGELNDDGSFAYGSNVYPRRSFCVNPGSEPTPFVWIKEAHEQIDVHHWHSLGMIISVPFLVATLLVYLVIPDLRNIPGKSLMAYVVALTSSYVTLILIKRSIIDRSPEWCTAIGYLCYYCLMTSFFWLNLMAFDIYWTFGGRRRSTTDRGKFYLYCCYAYGVPLVFLALALVADNTELLHSKIRPGFGDGQCLFRAETLISLLYLYLPLGFVVSSNLFFFISTAAKINHIERSTAAALQGDSGRHSKYTNERNRYGLYVRLFVVMGVTWMFELITWVADSHNWLVYATDICNCISGVFIFFLFVWKRKVLMLLQERLKGKQVRKQVQPLFSVTATKTTSLTQTASAPKLESSSN